MKIKKSILPKLALQFINNHYVRHFRQWDSGTQKRLEGEVEIRILDYKLDKTSGASSTDATFEEVLDRHWK